MNTLMNRKLCRAWALGIALAATTPVNGARADDRGARVAEWCSSYNGRADTEHWCTGVVNWCWDVCRIPDGSKKHFEGPYTCGVCLLINF